MRHLFSATKIAALVCVLALGCTARAQAAAITVANPGFDAPIVTGFTVGMTTYNPGDPIPPNYYVSGVGSNLTVFSQTDGSPTSGTANFTGWTPVGDTDRVGDQNPPSGASGLANPGDLGFFTAIAGGGFTGTGGFSQDLGVSLLPNTTYVLNVELLSKGLAVPPTIFSALTVGGTPLVGTEVTVAPTGSTLGSDTVTFTTGLSPTHGDLGILLEASDPSGNLSQIMWDNVTLNATPLAIPEPSSAVLAALGVLGCALAGLRRRVMRKVG